jgi:hypothetical protein
MKSHDSQYFGIEEGFVRNSEEGPPKKVEIHKGPGGGEPEGPSGKKGRTGRPAGVCRRTPALLRQHRDRDNHMG